jgi:hypothetical protein
MVELSPIRRSVKKNPGHASPRYLAGATRQQYSAGYFLNTWNIAIVIGILSVRPTRSWESNARRHNMPADRIGGKQIG